MKLVLIQFHWQRIVTKTRHGPISAGAKYEVEVESGLDEKKGLEILALYTDNKPHGLPEEARSIVRECKGLYSSSA